MHSQLRFAMDNLKNDIRRAGFNPQCILERT